MSEPDKTVECDEHGPGVATFVCRHLRDGVGCGFHADEDADDSWPDAWCDRCEVERVRSGGWTEESDIAADISLLCNRCYEVARELNRQVPAPLVAGTIDVGAADVGALVRRACHEVQALQERAREAFEFGSHERWAADYEAGLFSMTSAGRAQIVADMQLVGSFSKVSSSWLWSWANDINEPHLVQEVARLRTFGEVRGIGMLVERYQAPVDEIHCWELTQLACYLLGYEACYRAPMDQRFLFMILKNMRWVS